MRLCIEICGLLPITSAQHLYLYLYIVYVLVSTYFPHRFYSFCLLLDFCSIQVRSFLGGRYMSVCSLILRLYKYINLFGAADESELLYKHVCTCMYIIMLSTSSSVLGHHTGLVDLITRRGWQG